MRVYKTVETGEKCGMILPCMFLSPGSSSRNACMAYYTRWLYLTLLGLWLFFLIPGSHAEVSVNLSLDDPAYPLLDKLVTSNLTFTNALTIKPVTRLYAARLIAEAIEQRRQELDTGQRPEPFLDEILEYLTGRFKRELQEV